MGKKKEADAPEVEIFAGLLSSVAWVEDAEFYTCKVKFGGDDYARLLAISGDVTDMAVDLLGDCEAILPAIAGSETVEAGLKVLLDFVAPERRERIWRLVEQVFTRCVSELSLKGYVKAFGVDEPQWPMADEPADMRLAFVKGLPLKLVARVIVGVGLHLGN